MQDADYLAAHKIMQQQELEIARLQAQVEELQGDVSRLTIENGQLKENLSLFAQADGLREPLDIPLQAVYDKLPPQDELNAALVTQVLGNEMAKTTEVLDKPTKKPRARK